MDLRLRRNREYVDEDLMANKVAFERTKQQVLKYGLPEDETPSGTSLDINSNIDRLLDVSKALLTNKIQVYNLYNYETVLSGKYQPRKDVSESLMPLITNWNIMMNGIANPRLTSTERNILITKVNTLLPLLKETKTNLNDVFLEEVDMGRLSDVDESSVRFTKLLYMNDSILELLIDRINRDNYTIITKGDLTELLIKNLVSFGIDESVVYRIVNNEWPKGPIPPPAGGPSGGPPPPPSGGPSGGPPPSPPLGSSPPPSPPLGGPSGGPSGPPTPFSPLSSISKKPLNLSNFKEVETRIFELQRVLPRLRQLAKTSSDPINRMMFESEVEDTELRIEELQEQADSLEQVYLEDKIQNNPAISNSQIIQRDKDLKRYKQITGRDYISTPASSVASTPASSVVSTPASSVASTVVATPSRYPDSALKDSLEDELRQINPYYDKLNQAEKDTALGYIGMADFKTKNYLENKRKDYEKTNKDSVGGVYYDALVNRKEKKVREKEGDIFGSGMKKTVKEFKKAPPQPMEYNEDKNDYWKAVLNFKI